MSQVTEPAEERDTSPGAQRDAERRQHEAAATYGVPSPSQRPSLRKQHGPVLPAMVIALCLLAFVVLRDPSMAGTRLRQLVTGQSRISPMVDVPQGRGHYDFTDTQADGSPVSYDPCQRIHYVINPLGAPPGYEQLVAAAIAEVSRDSGFDFAYDGSTRARSFDSSAVSVLAQNPVLVMWATPSEVPRLDDDVIGLGGSAAVDRNHRLVYITGGIALDRDEFAKLAAHHDTAEEQAIVMHELGHVLGLAHVHDAGELMNADNLGRTAFGKGDLKGLALLGRVPCVA